MKGHKYTPVEIQKRNQWNQFLKYLQQEGIAGSATLNRGANPTQRLLNQYRSVNPQFGLTPEDVKNIQYEMLVFKNSGKFPGYDADVKTQMKKYTELFNQKDLSKVDGWIGSRTSQEFYPSAAITYQQLDSKGKETYRQHQHYGADMDAFASHEGMSWKPAAQKNTPTATPFTGAKVTTPVTNQEKPQSYVPVGGRPVRGAAGQTLGTITDDGVFVPISGTAHLNTANKALFSDPYKLETYLIENAGYQPRKKSPTVASATQYFGKPGRMKEGGEQVSPEDIGPGEKMDITGWTNIGYETKPEPKTFKEAFAKARRELGAGEVFTWKGKKYTTDYANEKDRKTVKKKEPSLNSQRKHMVDSDGYISRPEFTVSRNDYPKPLPFDDSSRRELMVKPNEVFVQRPEFLNQNYNENRSWEMPPVSSYRPEGVVPYAPPGYEDDPFIVNTTPNSQGRYEFTKPSGKKGYFSKEGYEQIKKRFPELFNNLAGGYKRAANDILKSFDGGGATPLNLWQTDPFATKYTYPGYAAIGNTIDIENDNYSGVPNNPQLPDERNQRKQRSFWKTVSAAGQVLEPAIGAGAIVGNMIRSRNDHRDMEAYAQQQGLSDNLFAPTGATRGDYMTNTGAFRPGQSVPFMYATGGVIPGDVIYKAPMAPEFTIDDSMVSEPAQEERISMPEYKPSKVKPNKNAEYAYEYYLSKGLKPHIAAGIVGNLYQESSMNPTAVNKSSGAFGLAQWLGDRKGKLFAWANKNGLNPYDLTTQLDYVLNEPKESKRALRELEKTTTPQEAAVRFADVYERMGKHEANYGRRVGIAQKLFSKSVPQMEEGGEYDLTEEQIQAILEAGGEVEFL